MEIKKEEISSIGDRVSILDIDYGQMEASNASLISSFISEVEPDYRDLGTLKEHLYGMSIFMDSENNSGEPIEEKYKPLITAVSDAIEAQADSNNLCYVRFVKN